MKILLFPYSEELGTTHSLVRIAEELQKKGHTIYFAGSGEYVSFIEKNGFIVFPIIELDYDYYQKKVRKASMDYHSEATIQKFVSEEVKLIEELQPDVVVDVFRPTLFISSKIAKVQRISISNAIITKYYNLPLEIPEEHWAAPFLTHQSVKSFMYPVTGIIARISFGHWAAPYNKVLRQNGLVTVKSILELFEGDKTIIMDATEFAPLKKIDTAKVFPIGPILHAMTYAFPNWYDLLDIQKNIIYVSMGSTGDLLPTVLEDLVKLYADNDNYQIVANTVGKYAIQKEILPANFFIEDFLNPEHILDKASLFITHGGRGSIYHALQKGVPIIGIPHQPEQEWNLNQVDRLHLGKKISKRNYNLLLLKSNIEDVLDNSEFKINSVLFSKTLLSYNGPESAAKIITSTL